MGKVLDHPLPDDGWLRRVDSEGEVYPLPFIEDDDNNYDDDVSGEVDLPRTLIELKMTRLSAVLRDKPDWIRKSRDEGIMAKWRDEALKQQEGLREEEKLTEGMVRAHRSPSQWHPSYAFTPG